MPFEKLVKYISFLSAIALAQLAWAKPYVVQIDPRDHSKIRIVFFTGIRYFDGLGDLTLNKYLILEQLKSLKEAGKLNTGSIEMHIVYLNEPALKTKTPYKGRQAVELLYQEEEFSSSLALLKKKELENRESTPPVRDDTSGTTYWTEDSFRSFIERNESVFDLGFIASEVSRSLPWNNPEYKPFQIPDWIKNHLNIFAFREYSMGNKSSAQSYGPAQYARIDAKLSDIQGQKTSYLTAQIESGPDAAGMIFNSTTPAIKKSTLMEMIRKDLSSNEGRFREIRLAGSSRRKKILTGDPWLITSRTNSYADEMDRGKIAAPPLLLAFAHYQIQRKKGIESPGYLAFFNEVDTDLGKIHEDLETSLSHNFPKMKKGGKIKIHEELDYFLKNELLFLKAGKQVLSTPEIRGFFAAENKALFAVVGGFGTIADAMDVGTFPLLRLRSYHTDFWYAFMKICKRLASNIDPRNADELSRLILHTSSMNEYCNFWEYAEKLETFRPLLNHVLNRLKSGHNLSHYISQIILELELAREKVGSLSDYANIIEWFRAAQKVKRRYSPFFSDLGRNRFPVIRRKTSSPSNCATLFK